ncbi:hypothetical protein F5Y16DRAFT_358262 [Xylariaceae sp. FL0255]|nr:hypothetical protein F5Y16DRAFT_358262 [Xylariaceae sp. FL0255]
MASSEPGFEEDDTTTRRVHGGPHSGKHPIPTVQGYREHRKELEGQEEAEERAQEGPEDESKAKRAFKSAKAIIKGEDTEPKTRHDPYPSTNHNYAEPRPTASQEFSESENDVRMDAQTNGKAEDKEEQPSGKEQQHDDSNEKTATEHAASTSDPKEKRKIMKKKKRHGEGREVTDPVTHLPLTIHDQTDKDLNSIPENEGEPGTKPSTSTGPAGASKSQEELQLEQERVQKGYNGMQRLFPPPEFDITRQALASLYQKAVCAGLAVMGLLTIPFILNPLHLFVQDAPRWSDQETNEWLPPPWSTALSLLWFFGLGTITILGLGRWVNKRTNDIFDDEVWAASRREENAILSNDEELPESVQWLNSLVGSIWPLINPDLFASLVDQIEDVMQASLPKVIRMVSVDDMGQGSESIRVLGVRWLPTGAASQSVESDGRLHKGPGAAHSDRTDPQNPQDEAEDDDSSSEKKPSNEKVDHSKQKEEEEAATREGMEAEEGDFVNLELALAYRIRSSGESISSKAKSAHLYLKFYLPGGVAIPVWVQLRGIVMTVRLRLQLTPDPPFISLCTMTFLGQPKASIGCTPLSKHSFSLTDVPLISSFVNSAIDAALAEYVAPKSLTLNLKDLLVGEDFKKDTASLGVIFIFIKRASGFKQGDGGVGPTKGGSDAYCTVSWGKFGKAVASTRIITTEGNSDPSWHEYSSILVTNEELNAHEKLRLQLWDSDKWTADDDLGRVEVDLKTLMKAPNKMHDREDRFTGEDVEEEMPGSLVWSVGYFGKTRITPQQLEVQTVDENIRSKESLKEHISDSAENKLRESGKPSNDDEVRQQKSQDYKELETSMIISAPPSNEFISGILSVQIHNVTGLEIQSLQKQDKGDGQDAEDEAERAHDLPDSYCTIILNHKKIYRTRTKPKNSKPFFNAGTERFVRDWRDTEVIISVRDSREREDDPLIGLIYLPLPKVFKDRSQVAASYSLVGGIGYGRARVSMVWRSVELKLPKNITGWDYGTLQIRGPIKPKSGLSEELVKDRLKIKTNMGHAKLYADEGCWKGKGKRKTEETLIPVRKRYSSAMVVEFRGPKLGPDKTSAFAVLWLQDLEDEEDEVKTLKVWKYSKESLRRAQSCCEFDGLGDDDQPLGEIEIPIRFWRGLSGYHKAFANRSKNTDMRDVIECLDTISDEGLEVIDHSDSSDDEDDHYTAAEGDEDSDATTRKKLAMHSNDDSTPPSSVDDNERQERSSSSSFSASSPLSDFKKGVKTMLHDPTEGLGQAATAVLAPGHNDPDDGSRGVQAQIRDYKDHHTQLHRKHRGIMQWKAAREANHLGGKLTRMKDNLSEIFQHGDKDTGVETEV